MLSLYFVPHLKPSRATGAGRLTPPKTAQRKWRGSCAVLAVLLFSLPALAQQSPGNVLLEPNEQIFCVLAALNAAGYDTGLSVNTGDDTREEVRANLARQKSPIVPELERFYAGHRIQGDPGADLGQYISLALLLGPPPEFKFTVPQTDLPPDAKDVADLVPLLKKFYGQAGLLALWGRMQPRYQSAVERYSPAIRDSLVHTDAYFRMATAGYLGRDYTIYLDLLGAPDQVQARIYGYNYFLVVTPSRELKLDEIRHQYLHFLLDPLAAKYAPEINQKVGLRAVAYQAPSLATDFKQDFPLLVTECLTRAAELRMDKRAKADAEKSLQEMTASGLILVRYFYEALERFERQEAGMMIYYKPMVLGIDVAAEEKRLAGVKFTPKAAPAASTPAPVVSEEDRALDHGDNLFFQGRYIDARSEYQTVLEKLDPKSERALFGMAVVAANMRKPDLALDYFQKTLAVARDLRLVTWSHIYLGRLDDLLGKRDDALAQYRAASLTAAAFPEAARAVQSGLQRPFGSKESE
ncbi:MAG: tetratricopeptide repeat protein [Acidobacteriia bacterium]|nr:tetratricopeptide repeat protein [Terriglobia bacterium]